MPASLTRLPGCGWIRRWRTFTALPRHVPVVEELLSREPYPAPKFALDPSVTDFYSFTKDSVKLEGYQFHPLDTPIPVAV